MGVPPGGACAITETSRMLGSQKEKEIYKDDICSASQECCLKRYGLELKMRYDDCVIDTALNCCNGENVESVETCCNDLAPVCDIDYPCGEYGTCNPNTRLCEPVKYPFKSFVGPWYVIFMVSVISSVYWLKCRKVY